MYGDGITLVYDAYSILKTGHDQKGEFLPLVFSLGGGRPAGYVYATIPFVAILGPTAEASRMVSVLSGIGIVLLLYLLGKKLFSENASLAVATLAAINPWELSLSRGPFESHFALFLTMLGIYSFIRGLEKKYWLVIFGLSFALASQTYSTYKLTVPLLTALLFFWAGKKFFRDFVKKPAFLLSVFIITVSTLLSIYLMISKGSQDRFQSINIFSSPDLRSAASQTASNYKMLDSLPLSISHKLHTPQIEFAGVWAENYIDNFLPSFLFLHGDGQPRHNPAEMGEFFWVDVVLLLIGIAYLYKSNKKLLLLLAGWILISPVPTSLVGKAHAIRSSLLLPPLLILTGLGLYQLWNQRKKPAVRILLITLSLLFIIQFVYFIDRFYFVAPQKNTRFWSYPAKEAALIALKNKQKFDFVVLSNDIDNMEYAYPTYVKLDPMLVIEQNRSRSKIGEYSFFKYDNIYIGSLPNSIIMQFIKSLPGSVLYIGSDKEQKYLENYTIITGFDKLPNLVITSKGKAPEL